jgi:hypothetical protein
MWARFQIITAVLMNILVSWENASFKFISAKVFGMSLLLPTSA